MSANKPPFVQLLVSTDPQDYVANMPPEVKSLFLDLYSLPPRFTPIVVGSMLDELLAEALKARLVEEQHSADMVDGMTNGQRLDASQALGIVIQEFADAARKIATVRNHFAHKSNPLYRDEKASRALRGLWDRFVRMMAFNQAYPEADITYAVAEGIKSLDSEEDHGRLLILMVYAMLHGFLTDLIPNITRVDVVWHKSTYAVKKS